LDLAKARLEEGGYLTEFYTFLGSFRGPKKKICQEIQQRYRRFLAGDVAPSEAWQCRQHLQVCTACFWAFSDYVDNRIAWGYQPQPMVAALREHLRALDSPWKKRLRLKLSNLPMDLYDILESLHGQMNFSSPGPPFVFGDHKAALREWPMDPKKMLDSIRTQTRANKPKGKATLFKGFPFQPGDRIALSIEGTEDKRVQASALVIASECVPEIHAASLVLQTEGLPKTVKVLAARAIAANNLTYSLAAELRNGKATLSVTDFPDEFGGIHIEAWYAIDEEENEESNNLNTLTDRDI
jgi:hypothetical protein